MVGVLEGSAVVWTRQEHKASKIAEPIDEGTILVVSPPREWPMA
jgi:hypothetical protein